MNLFIWIFPNITVTSNFEGNFWKYQGLWLTWTDRWRRHHLGRSTGHVGWQTGSVTMEYKCDEDFRAFADNLPLSCKWGKVENEMRGFFFKEFARCQIGNKKYFTLPSRSITSSQKVSFPNSIFTFDFTLKWIVI
jgi:hypothetical protein